tara:strand:- start:12464 stop:13567 length:1104 start_codon:yes stop_codon:yes gene_type:complete
MKKILLTLLILFSTIVSCDNSESDLVGPSYDRSSLLINWHTFHIQPGLNKLKLDLDQMNESAIQFENQRDLNSLKNLRDDFISAYIKWQRVEMFNIGKAEELYYNSKMNIYPSNTARIESNISSEEYDLLNANNFAAQGFPAIDYLLYGIGSSDEEILEKYTIDEKYINYLMAITNTAKNNTKDIVNSWEVYKYEFISSTENTATSSVNLVVNDFLFYYEKGFRANKFGIPGGVFSSMPLPENVEGYYSREHSKQLAQSAINYIKNFYEGINGDNNNNYPGSSLKSIITDLDTKEGNKNLGYLISNKIDNALNKISMLDDDFVNQIQNNNTELLQTYDAIQEVVVLLKVDMLQLLSINVDYVDADGD